MEQRQIVLLRGINVGRANRIAMAELRAALAARGYREVTTVLQSGNVILSADRAAEQTAADVAALVERQFGLTVPAVARTGRQLAAAIAADPLRRATDDGAKYLLGFLFGRPDPDRAATLLADNDPAELAIVDDHVYLWCPRGVLESPFATVDWRRDLGVDCTMRNWRTLARVTSKLAAGE